MQFACLCEIIISLWLPEYRATKLTTSIKYWACLCTGRLQSSLLFVLHHRHFLLQDHQTYPQMKTRGFIVECESSVKRWNFESIGLRFYLSYLTDSILLFQSLVMFLSFSCPLRASATDPDPNLLRCWPEIWYAWGNSNTTVTYCTEPARHVTHHDTRKPLWRM